MMTIQLFYSQQGAIEWFNRPLPYCYLTGLGVGNFQLPSIISWRGW